MNILERGALALRLKAAWALVPADVKAQAQPLIDAAHRQLADFQATGQATHRPGVPHQLLLVKGLLQGEPAAAAEAVEVAIAPGGEIWGTGKYQQLDLGWAEAAAIWMEHIVLGKHAFPSGQPRVIPIPDDATIALAGDFGTGNWLGAATPAPAVKVAQAMAALHADYTIHLGDVYYAGQGSEETDYLLKMWPAGSRGSFALNSNHEMYSGGKPYFAEALGSALFSLQGGMSYFALENSQWIVVALDSAYYASEANVYLDGSLGPGPGGGGAQLDFLKQQALKGKKVIVLTHHNGLQEDGSAPTALFGQVMSAFPAGAAPVYWYWGHVHAAVVYEPAKADPAQAGSPTVFCRCSGHAALPWAYAAELASNQGDGGNRMVAWFESRNASDPADPVRVLNGFTVLQFQGANFNESFYDENGAVAWTPAQQVAGAGTGA